MQLNRPSGSARFASFVVLAWLLAGTTAWADVTNVDVTNAPIVRINLRQADVVIRTWDRPSVQVDGDPSLVVERRVARIPGSAQPQLISPGRISDGGTPIEIPAESFVISSVTPGPHEVVFVRGGQVGPVTVTVPTSTQLVAAGVARGSVDLENYRGGTFIIHVRTGRATLHNDGGDGFVQVLRGPLLASDSSFNRLRARSALGNQVFERCNVRQIEASNVGGSIVYDGGTFEPGLARFDSARGDVAVGVAGGAQLGGRTAAGGRVYTMFGSRAQVDAHDAAASAVVAGGGPVVTATSGSGNVFLYDGSLHERRNVPAEWHPAQMALDRPAMLPSAARANQPARPSGQPHQGRRRKHRDDTQPQ